MKWRGPLLLLAGAGALAASYVGYQAVQTLRVLDAVESERDGWQRPREIIEPLNLKDGSVVADIGSGAGYFALKLAPMVGAKGMVLAIDLRRESLAFLWIRAFLRSQRNVRVIHGDAEDPQLFGTALDAVLIANTYHEFARPGVVLRSLFQAIRPDGRLVVVDRGLLPEREESREGETEHHERKPAAVESELREAGFEVIGRDDDFIGGPASERPGDRRDNHPWWLIVSLRPAPKP